MNAKIMLELFCSLKSRSSVFQFLPDDNTVSVIIIKMP